MAAYQGGSLFLNYFFQFVIRYYLISQNRSNVSGETERIYAFTDLKINGFGEIKQKKGIIRKQQAVEETEPDTVIKT